MFFPPFSSFPVDWRRRNGLCFSSKYLPGIFWWCVKAHAAQGMALFWQEQGLPKPILSWDFRFIPYPLLLSWCASLFQSRGCVSQSQEGQCFSGPWVHFWIFFFFLAIISVNNESFTQIFPFILTCSSSAAASVHGWKRLNFTALWEVQQEFIVSKTWLEVSRSWLAGCLSQSMFFGVKDTKGC